jgi:hypothetical protein
MILKLNGKKCSCGVVLGLGTTGFKILDADKAADETVAKNAIEEKEVVKEPVKEPSRYTTPELLSKGHQSKTIHLFGKDHPNPLRSNSVLPTIIVEEPPEEGLQERQPAS